jgi:hypothetical protein
MADVDPAQPITSALPDDIREAVAVGNVKTIGESAAFYNSLSMANAVAMQQAMNQISQAATGKVVESIIETRPSEGGIDVAALQQLLKGAQTTPPPTA